MMTTTERHENFRNYFSVVLDDIKGHLLRDLQLPCDALEHFEKLIAHCLVGGKLYRGILVVDTVCAIQEAKGVTTIPQDILNRAYAAGWAIEWLQAALLVADDVMDESETRRGQPCWYRMPNVGSKAINDALLLESQSFLLLRKYFGGEACYSDIIETFHEVTYLTKCGQLIDVLTTESAIPRDIAHSEAVAITEKKITDARRALMARLKTTFYTYYLPLALAMCICGEFNAQAAREARSLLEPIGDYFQIQDDYLDVYGDPAQSGKIGTDILDGKCAWPVVEALARADEETRQELLTIYAASRQFRGSRIVLSRVHGIFKEVGLPAVYAALEKQRLQEISQRISEIDTKTHPVPPHVYLGMLQKIHGRKK